MATAAIEVNENTAAEQKDQAHVQPSTPKVPTCALCDGAATTAAVLHCATCDKQFCDNHGKVSRV